MSAPTPDEPLRALFDTPGARELYTRLLRGRPRTIGDVRAIAPAGIALADALETLEVNGLVGIDDGGLTVADPRDIVSDIVRARLVRRSSAWHDIAAASTELAALAVAWREPDRADTVVPGSVTVGDAAHWWRGVLADGGAVGIAARRVDALESWHRAGVLGTLFAARSAATRILVSADVLGDLAGRTVVEALAAEGVEMRVARRVPGWLAVGTTVTLARTWGEAEPTGATCTDEPSIAVALRGMFADWWAHGIPLAAIDVFALLAAGMDDAEIAATLVVSVRTVQRRIGVAMGAVGARSRFELGAAWARSPSVVAAAGAGMGN